jgi:hypothetical protein
LWVFAALAAALPVLAAITAFAVLAAIAAFPAFAASVKRQTGSKGEAGEAEAGISQPKRAHEDGQPDLVAQRPGFRLSVPLAASGSAAVPLRPAARRPYLVR